MDGKKIYLYVLLTGHKKQKKNSHRVHEPCFSGLHVAASLAQELDPTWEAAFKEKVHPKISGLPGTIQKNFHRCFAMLRGTQT